MNELKIKIEAFFPESLDQNVGAHYTQQNMVLPLIHKSLMWAEARQLKFLKLELK